jgi:hypothetical protein
MRRLRIASPCPERWDAMQGDDLVRHCDRCKKDVRTIRSLAEAIPGSCVRILVSALAATAIAGCSSATLEPPPTKTIVVPPPDAGPVQPNLDEQILGFVDEIVDLPPPPETKR